MSPVVTQVIADENGEVHSWTSSATYVPSNERGNAPEYSDQMMEVRMAGPGTRIYQVSDDPAYDLSGPRDQWFLVGDGTAFREDSWRGTAALVSAGGMHHEIVPVPAEYRQDWLAVAAGDRPVRTFDAPRSVMDTGAMASNVETTEHMAYHDQDRVTSARNADTFRPVHHPRRHTRAHYTAMRHRTYHHRHHAAMTAAHRSTRSVYHSTRTTAAEPTVAVAAESGMEIRHDEMGHELFQMGGSWYMKDNGDWFRSESWRGPFVHVRKGMVPREVRMSAKHPSRTDMD
jgi:hypothetical protein